MDGLKQKIKRSEAKVYRKLVKKDMVVITRDGRGLKNKENTEVLDALRAARRRGELPSLTYEYNRYPWERDPIYVKPKDANLAKTAVGIRGILRRDYGDKYRVKLS